MIGNDSGTDPTRGQEPLGVNRKTEIEGTYMRFHFQYKVIYESGDIFEQNRRNELCVDITQEEYKKIITGVLQGISIKQIEGISEVITKMTEDVLFADRWMNKNGSMRSTPLKKNRKISEIEFFMTENELQRIKKEKDPIRMLERPKEQMTVYRSDGTYITLETENGQVIIKDSTEKNSYRIVDADYFIHHIVRG